MTDLSLPKNILVRVPNWIGDAVMCLPALRDLRNCFKHADITVVAKPTIAGLLDGQCGIKEFIVYEHQTAHCGLLGLLRLSQVIRKRAFDAAVLFQNAFEAAVLAVLSGIPSRIGYATDGRSWLLTQAIPVPLQAGLHQTHYYQQLIQKIAQGSLGDSTPKLSTTMHDYSDFEQRFPDICSSSNRLLIGINPGSVYGSAKRWLPERFAELGDELVERIYGRHSEFSSVRCVLIGGKGEDRLGLDIARQMRTQPIVLSGKTTVQELMAVLVRCTMLVTNDTGPMHVAQALGIPVVALFGATDPETTGPVGGESCVIREQVRCSPCLLRACPIDHRCMSQISTDRVVKSVMEHIDRFVDRQRTRECIES